ncbi:uncharacterized protein YbjT (DUF2867 family) [Sphingomonas sp. UYAg733]
MSSSESTQRGQSIAVFGASGHTGRFVIAELQRRGFVPIAIGRDAARLISLASPGQAVETRVATVEDAASLDRALIGAAAVINCAGPFLDTADALATAAVRARIHYLDVTPEQSSALATFERFAAPAQAAGIVLVPAMGFYGGLGDLLATAAMGDWALADEIRIGIALDSWQPTPGTRLTGQRNTARRLVIAGGELVPLADPAPQVSWTFADPFGVQDAVEMPMTETVLISRHLRTDSLHTYLNLAPLLDLRDPSTPPPSPVDEMGRSAQIFLMEAIVRKGPVERRASAHGQDIYAFTAPLVVEAVQRILAGAVDARGVLAPGEIFDARDFLRALAPEHLTVEIS